MEGPNDIFWRGRTLKAGSRTSILGRKHQSDSRPGVRRSPPIGTRPTHRRNTRYCASAATPAGDKASRDGTAPKRPVHKRNKPTRNDVHVGCMINGELGWRRSLILHRTTSSADGPVTLLATAAKADATQDGGRQGHKHARFRYGRKGHKTPLPTQSSVELAFFKITGKVEGAAHEHRVADSL